MNNRFSGRALLNVFFVPLCIIAMISIYIYIFIYLYLSIIKARVELEKKRINSCQKCAIQIILYQSFLNLFEIFYFNMHVVCHNFSYFSNMTLKYLILGRGCGM